MPSDFAVTLLLIEIIAMLIPLLIIAMSGLDSWLVGRRPNSAAIKVRR